jgi:ABC-type branched-subunit amino acid transport system ATPase component
MKNATTMIMNMLTLFLLELELELELAILQNGAGKTTTMNMLTGMLPVTAGRAYVNGRDVRTQMSQVTVTVEARGTSI